MNRFWGDHSMPRGRVSWSMALCAVLSLGCLLCSLWHTPSSEAYAVKPRLTHLLRVRPPIHPVVATLAPGRLPVPLRPKEAAAGTSTARGSATGSAATPKGSGGVSPYRVAAWLTLCASIVLVIALRASQAAPPSLSSILGALSMGIWLVSQVPQMVKNQRRRKAEDLSLDFLLLWTAGDLCNLAGCFLIEGTLTQRILSVYFIFCNIVLLGQWWAFGRKDSSSDGLSPASKAFWLALIGSSTLGLVNCLWRGVPKTVTGGYLGWVSGAVYLISRVPQIWQNQLSRRVDDLSPLLFLLAALGNTTYAASILTVSVAPAWLRLQAPFLVGSLGTLVFDAILLAQIAVFRKPPPPASDESKEQSS